MPRFCRHADLGTSKNGLNLVCQASRLQGDSSFEKWGELVSPGKPSVLRRCLSLRMVPLLSHRINVFLPCPPRLHPLVFPPLLRFKRCRDEDGIIIGSKHGYATNFLATTRDLRPSGRASRGVKVSWPSMIPLIFVLAGLLRWLSGNVWCASFCFFRGLVLRRPRKIMYGTRALRQGRQCAPPLRFRLNAM